MRVTGAWSRDEVVDYLREETVPLRLACHTTDGGLWMLSLWYRWQANALWCATAADADVVDYLRAGGQVAFEVSTNDPPYRGVRGNGSTAIQPDSNKELLRELIERYLGTTDSSLAASLLSPDREEVSIRIDPERLHAWDYSGRMDERTD